MTTMAEQAESVIPAEADLDRAPGLLAGANSVKLTPQACNLEYWLGAVAQGTLRGLVHGGHRAEAVTPAWMREPGPLRQALIEEFAFRSIAEEKATRALSYLVLHAPDIDTMEFFATQLIDEARHSSVFRGHLLELGVAQDELSATIEQVAGEDREKILVPLEHFGLPLGRDAGDFIGGVCVLTVLVEGVLAPAAELSELKWRLLDPAAAEIERAAGIDEIRHLTVGSTVRTQTPPMKSASYPSGSPKFSSGTRIFSRSSPATRSMVAGSSSRATPSSSRWPRKTDECRASSMSCVAKNSMVSTSGAYSTR